MTTLLKLKRLQMKSGRSEFHLYIYDEISSLGGFSLRELQDKLDTSGISKTDRLVIHINSIGGSVVEGIGIYNILKTYTNVETICEGTAASMASILMLTGKTRKIYDNATVMVHNPVVFTSGNAAQISKDVENLRTYEGIAADIYAQELKGKSTLDQIRGWMNEEKVFTAKEALEVGFATEIVSPIVGSAKVAKKKIPQISAKITRNHLLSILGLKNHDPQPKESVQNPSEPVDATKDYRLKMAEEEQRVSRISMVTNNFLAKAGKSEVKLSKTFCEGAKVPFQEQNEPTIEDLKIHAIREGWSVDQFELAVHRGMIQDTGHIGIQSKNSRTGPINAKAMQIALLRSVGYPSNTKTPNGKTIGLEKEYNEKELEASDSPMLRDVTLLQALNMVYRSYHGHPYDGRLNHDGFIAEMRSTLQAMRMSGNTQWSSLNIFDDVANKMLLSAYEMIATTWQNWVFKKSVTDFKNANLYRLVMTGSYQKVAPDGMLTHGGLTDSKFTVKAETYGKIVGLSRTDIINDDLGALSGIMNALGEEAAVFLEELFYVQLLGNLTTLFPTNDANKNYISGATTTVSVDGLTLGVQKFLDQVDQDGRNILQNPEIMIVGNNNKVKAWELFNKTELVGTQSANAKGQPDGNPHVGLYSPISSGFLSNTNLKQRAILPAGVTAIPGQSQTHWLLARRPREGSGGIVNGAFLNGKVTPILESGDAQFDMLGLQWRAYHDVGAANGDPRLAIYSKGAA